MKTATAVLYVCALGFAAGTSHASEFDQAMQPVLTEYLKIHAALAADIATASTELIERTRAVGFAYDYVAALLEEYYQLTREWQSRAQRRSRRG